MIRFCRRAAFLFSVCWIISPFAASAAGSEAGPSKPIFTVCEIYCPGHFGNSYEVMGKNEMHGVLSEAAFWGFNRYGDWFDSDDCKDPFSTEHTYGLGPALWESKKLHFQSAQSLKLECDLIITPNHVYVDQCLPEQLATKGPRVFGQLICPSNEAARKVILRNYEQLFRDLSQSGIHIARLNACPYDFGGCRCPKCDPWILTFASLSHEIYEIAKRYHPAVRMDMIGWWWTEQEHQQFADWVDREAPNWVDFMFLHIPYGQTKVADAVLPKGCRRGAFVHISYAEQTQPRDPYGHLGPLVAADRLERTVKELASQGVVGVMAYSEGIYEDVNKSILAGLGSGAFASADQVMQSYAQRYFGADEATSVEWVQWIRAWGKPFEVDLAKSRECLTRLKAKSPKDTWRLRQWELKQQLFEANQRIGTGDAWPGERLSAVDSFWSVQEQLYRGVWGLAPPRHIFARRYTPLPWYASWAKHVSTSASRMEKEQ
jgi:hypothetical protein